MRRIPRTRLKTTLRNCETVLIRGSYLSVNDDAIALKGGKGADADRRPENGANSDVVIENCTFGFCHSCLTCGSETVHNRNIVMRKCVLDGAGCLFRLKMRPDTPQKNEYIRLSEIRGNCPGEALLFDSWTQFRETAEVLPSSGEHILVEELDLRCKKLFLLVEPGEFHLEDVLVRKSRFTVDEPEIFADSEGIRCSEVEFRLRKE